MLGPTYHVVPREGSTVASSFQSFVENSLSLQTTPAVVPSLDRPNGGSNSPNGVAVNFSVDKCGAEACSVISGNGHASDTQTKELFVGRERYPFSAVGGVVLRLVFPRGGPDLRFFLCEVGTEVVKELIAVCTQVYGVPLLADPRWTR